MYLIVRKTNDNYLIEYDELKRIKGFLMSKRNKLFSVCNCEVKNILIVNKKLAYPFVSDIVTKKYDRFIKKITEFLVSDDESGDTFREALNQIEKFRMELKNKYRDFLKKKEMELMTKQLTTLQKEATVRLMDLQHNYYAMMQSGRGK